MARAPQPPVTAVTKPNKTKPDTVAIRFTLMSLSRLRWPFTRRFHEAMEVGEKEVVAVVRTKTRPGDFSRLSLPVEQSEMRITGVRVQQRGRLHGLTAVHGSQRAFQSEGWIS